MIIKQACPPILYSCMKKVYALFTKNTNETAALLFDGDDALFLEKSTKARIFGEYGAGQSTAWVLENTSCTIYSVDTSDEWVQKVRSGAGDSSRLDIRHVDLGPVGDWGRPKTYEFRNNFTTYVNSIWERDEKPDLVLIDGRFRVACFLSSLIHADAGTIIIFDDYTNRPHYRIVEEFLDPVSTCGRQACFVVSGDLNQDDVSTMLEQFRYVMD